MIKYKLVTTGSHASCHVSHTLVHSSCLDLWKWVTFFFLTGRQVLPVVASEGTQPHPAWRLSRSVDSPTEGALQNKMGGTACGIRGVSFPVILESLEECWSKPNTRKEGVASAASLLGTVSALDFLVTLTIVNKCLSYLSNLSRSLQERSIDVAKALAQVNVVKDCMKNNRKTVDDFHATCYKEAAGNIAEKSGIEITKPRTCGRQTKRTTPLQMVQKNTTRDLWPSLS